MKKAAEPAAATPPAETAGMAEAVAPAKASPPKPDPLDRAPIPAKPGPADGTPPPVKTPPVQESLIPGQPAKTPAPPKKAARRAPAKAAPAQRRPAAPPTAPAPAPPTAPAPPAALAPPTAPTPATAPAPVQTQPAPTATGEVPPQATVSTGPSAPTPAQPPATSKNAPPRIPPAPQRSTVPGSEAAEQKTDPWAKLVADPGHAPELLALAAVQILGPRAEDWARRTREAYPAASEDALARLAVAQFTRFGTVSSVFAAVAGSYTPIALLGADALTYAELILHVAAAYGHRPTAPARAADLLVLTQIHPTVADAEAALATARQPAYEDDATFSDVVWRLGRMAAAQAGVWTAIKGINHFFPGTTTLAAVLATRGKTRTMGARATRYYTQLSQSFGSSV